MHKTVRGILTGRVIELYEEIGSAEARIVDVEVTIVPESATRNAAHLDAPPMSTGLAKIYEVLSRSHRAGNWDDAEKHNEHQP